MACREPFFSEDFSSPSELPVVFFRNSRSLASAQSEPVSLNTRRLADRAVNWREVLKILQYQHRDLQGSFQLGIFRLIQKELVRRIAWLNSPGIQSQQCISVNTAIILHSSVGERVSKPVYVPVQAFLRTLCCGFKEVEMAESLDDLET